MTEEYTLRGWISPNPGCAELSDHDGGGWEPVYSRSSKQPDVLAAGDVIAHQLLYRDHGEILERWWKARGGHSQCSVCKPESIKS